jgi:hypothetical protein
MSPSGLAGPPRKIGVLVIQKEAGVEDADVIEMLSPEKCRSPTPGKHLAWLVILPMVGFHESPVTRKTEFVQFASNVVDDILAKGPDIDFNCLI